MVRVNPVSSFEKFGSTWVPDAVYQVSRSLPSWFWRRRFFKVFTIYGPGSHLGHVTWNIWTKFHLNIPWRLHMASCFSWGKEVWKCWIWVTLDKGQWMTLTLVCHISSCIIYFIICTRFHLTGFNSFLENYIFTNEWSVNIPIDKPFTSRPWNLLLAW